MTDRHVWNVERAQFTDQTVALNRPNTSASATIGNLPAVKGLALTSTGSRGPGRRRRCDADATWQAETAPNSNSFVNVATGLTFTPTTAEVGKRLRLAVTFVDNFGFAESAFSATTAPVLATPPALPVATPRQHR